MRPAFRHPREEAVHETWVVQKDARRIERRWTLQLLRPAEVGAWRVSTLSALAPPALARQPVEHSPADQGRSREPLPAGGRIGLGQQRRWKRDEHARRPLARRHAWSAPLPGVGCGIGHTRQARGRKLDIILIRLGIQFLARHPPKAARKPGGLFLLHNPSFQSARTRAVRELSNPGRVRRETVSFYTGDRP